MYVRVLNYTGLSIKLKWDSTSEIISCNTEKVIEAESGKAKLVRFHAKYKTISDSPIRAKGWINVIFESSKYEHTLILGGFMEGMPKYIGCISVNEYGKYLYTEYDREALGKRYPYAKFFNVDIDLSSSTGLMNKFRKIYNMTFNQSYCESRDGPMCDKVLGIPILILIFIVLCIFIFVIGTVLVLGLMNLSAIKK